MTAAGTDDRALAEPEAATVTWGLAEFVAAEEMSRTRGHWWSPDSDRLLVARADDAPVRRWTIADPANPHEEPTRIAYPAAGTENAEVTLYLLDLDGTRCEVVWDRERHPYLARVHWSSGGPPLLLVQSRDQREAACLSVDTETGATSVTLTENDPIWLELFGGVPAWAPDGSLVRITDDAGRPDGAAGASSGARVLMAGARPLTPATLHVRAVLDIGDEDVLFSASEGDGAPRSRPGDIGVYRVPLAGGEPVRITDGDEPHVASAVRGGGTLVLSTANLSRPGSRAVRPAARGRHRARGRRARRRRVVRRGAGAPHRTAPGAHRAAAHPGGRRPAHRIPGGGRTAAGADGSLRRAARAAGGGRAQRASDGPVVRRPGGSRWSRPTAAAPPGTAPAGRRPSRAGWPPSRWTTRWRRWSRWPRSTRWTPLGSASAAGPTADISRARAVLRRPDVFHAAVAGAPVTDWRLYDTHYTERYCGTPQDDPEVYAESSLITDAGLAGVDRDAPHRPMMIIHGLADDNVVVGHALRLSSALLAAGRAHEVLPLSGVTHMAGGAEVAENLLLLQVDFLKRSLGTGG